MFLGGFREEVFIKFRQWSQISSSDSQQSIAKNPFSIHEMIKNLPDVPCVRWKNVRFPMLFCQLSICQTFQRD